MGSTRHRATVIFSRDESGSCRHDVTDHRAVETAETRWVITWDTESSQLATEESSSHSMISASVVRRTVWKMSGNWSSEFKHELFRLEMKIKDLKYVHCKFIF